MRSLAHLGMQALAEGQSLLLTLRPEIMGMNRQPSELWRHVPITASPFM